MLVTGVLLVLTAVAAATDLHRHKIPNWLTYGGIVAGLTLGGFFSAAAYFGWAEEGALRSWGLISFSESLLGLLACGFIMLLCFVMFRIGGGDVKLVAALGALAGVDAGLRMMLWTFVLGACAALIVLVWRVGTWNLVVGAARKLLYALRLGTLRVVTPEEREKLQTPLYLASCALPAVVVVQFQLVERWM